MSIELTGIDARNACGYLAALGTLRLLADSGRSTATLWWQRESAGLYRPFVRAPDLSTPDQLRDAVMDAHLSRDLDAELGWDTDLTALAHEDIVRELARAHENTRALQTVGACVCELPRRGAEKRVPYTPLRVIPRIGRARFLSSGHSISSKVTEKQMATGLFGPWAYVKANNMRWDPAATAPARAYTAEAPSKFGPLGVPGAVTLALAALVYFPLITTGRGAICRGQSAVIGGNRSFAFPAWTEPLTERGVRTIVGSPFASGEPAEMDWPRLRRHAIAAILNFRRERLGADSDILSWATLIEDPEIEPGR